MYVHDMGGLAGAGAAAAADAAAAAAVVVCGLWAVALQPAAGSDQIRSV